MAASTLAVAALFRPLRGADPVARSTAASTAALRRRPHPRGLRGTAPPRGRPGGRRRRPARGRPRHDAAGARLALDAEPAHEAAPDRVLASGGWRCGAVPRRRCVSSRAFVDRPVGPDSSGGSGGAFGVALRVLALSFARDRCSVACEAPRNAIGWLFARLGLVVGLLPGWPRATRRRARGARWPGSRAACRRLAPRLALRPALCGVVTVLLLMLFPDRPAPRLASVALVSGCGFVGLAAVGVAVVRRRSDPAASTRRLDNPLASSPASGRWISDGVGRAVPGRRCRPCSSPRSPCGVAPVARSRAAAAEVVRLARAAAPRGARPGCSPVAR